MCDSLEEGADRLAKRKERTSSQMQGGKEETNREEYPTIICNIVLNLLPHVPAPFFPVDSFIPNFGTEITTGDYPYWLCFSPAGQHGSSFSFVYSPLSE
jgi:hypothetical protein